VKYIHLLMGLKITDSPIVEKRPKNVKTCSYQPVLQVCKHEKFHFKLLKKPDLVKIVRKSQMDPF